MKFKDNLKLFIDKKSINKRVEELADKINSDYKNKNPLFIGILNGSFIFLSDIIRKLKLDIEIDFLKVSSYGQNKISSGDVRILNELNSSIEGKDIVVVEDIIDSGCSIKYINSLILGSNPGSLEYLTLLYKKSCPNPGFDIKYTGFKIPDKFVVGYGLDYAQKYRNLKSIYILNN